MFVRKRKSIYAFIKRTFCGTEMGSPIKNRSTRYFKNTIPEYTHNSKMLEQNKDDTKATITDYVSKIVHNFKPVDSNGDGGLYVGTVGVAYMLSTLSKCKLFNLKEGHAYLKYARDYLLASLNYAKTRANLKSEISSFLLGNAGVYAVAAVISRQLGEKDEQTKYTKLYAQAAENCKPKHFLRCGSDELFVGRAGYICGALWLAREIGTDVVPLHTLHELCATIIKSGIEYSKEHYIKCPLMYAYYNTEYLGAAHGVSFILLMLMSVPKYLETHPEESKLVRDSVDFLLEVQTESGNFPCALDEIQSGERSERDELVHWCHGAPGVVYTLAKAFVIWKDPKYLRACIKCGDLIWERGLLKKGPGLCHGVAGNGYVFLLLYRLTDDMKYLYKAKQFGDFLKTDTFKTSSRTPDSPYSLFEGLSGTVCFLVDILEPKQAAFPFIDI